MQAKTGGGDESSFVLLPASWGEAGAPTWQAHTYALFERLHIDKDFAVTSVGTTVFQYILNVRRPPFARHLPLAAACAAHCPPPPARLPPPTACRRPSATSATAAQAPQRRHTHRAPTRARRARGRR